MFAQRLFKLIGKNLIVWRFWRGALTASFVLTVSSALTGASVHAQDHSDRADTYFTEIYRDYVHRLPQLQLFLGEGTPSKTWNDPSVQSDEAMVAFLQDSLSLVRSQIDYDKLDEKTKLHYDIFVEGLEDDLLRYQFSLHEFPVRSFMGIQDFVITSLTQSTRASNTEQAQYYIARVKGVEWLFDALMEKMETQARAGIFAPRFSVQKSGSAAARHAGRFEIKDDSNDGADTTGHLLLDDFKVKLKSSDISQDDQNHLIEQLRSAIKDQLVPAYRKLAAYLKDYEVRTPHNGGVYHHANGGAYYNSVIKSYLGQSMRPEDLHQFGLKWVAFHHSQLKEAVKAFNYQGNLNAQSIFKFLRVDPQFYFSNDDAGRQQYLEMLEGYDQAVTEKLDELFYKYTDKDVVARRIEPYREQGNTIAFYSRDLDGTGVFYINLRDMNETPIYLAESLFYHEAFPGHHMTLNLADIYDEKPSYLQNNFMVNPSAFHEGWAMYAEQLAQDYGLSGSSVSVLGRILWDIIQSVRVVVETGVNGLGWNREQAIDYMVNNSSLTEQQASVQVERYMVFPGQALSYKMGMLTFLELREKAKEALGDDFDIREFHDVVLRNGRLSLPTLRQQANRWIEKRTKP